MKILVCGGRSYGDVGKIESILGSLNITSVVHGGCRGADILSERWAKNKGILVHAHLANWGLLGKKAGVIRNQEMIDMHPDLFMCVAFPGGAGTQDMVRRAKKSGLTVIEVR